MRIFLALAVFLIAAPGVAYHMDVIEIELKEGCSPAEYVAITRDFNATWGQNHGYRAEVAVPLQSENLTSLFWLGHSENAAAFGAAWDAWRDEVGDPKSVAGKLQARLNKCSTNGSRRSYDVY